MSDINTRPVIGASGAAVVLDRLQGGMRMLAASPPLSPEALAVASVAGTGADLADRARRLRAHGRVRADHVVGLALYAVYLPPERRRCIWRYLGAIVGIALLSMLAFQVADIYQVQAFRGYEKQYMRLASAWSVVFLIVIGASFFAKAGEQFSRVWLGTLLRRRPGRAARVPRARCSCWCGAGRARAGSTAAPSSSAAATPAKR